ncbi:MAG: efflux RND transporter permease subunit [Alphaproteobacteria bacterium]|nr:efflux RND transporter permease subunit [Alphaproteobacteria bacterium]
MILSDISIKRPVFATVVSVLMTAFGALAYLSLPLQENPDVESSFVSIETSYRGASAGIIDSRITEMIEDRVGGISGIKSIQSRSRDGQSEVNLEFEPSRDVDDAANDVRDAISRILDNVPDGADPPEIAKAGSSDDTVAYYHLNSSTMNNLELTDYAERFIVDQFAAIEGVARIRVSGQRYAMRIWLDRQALAARGLTVTDIEQRLRSENIELPAGSLESTSRDFTVRVPRAYRTADDFASLVIREGRDGHLIRLGELAEVVLAAEENRILYEGNGEPQVGIGINRQSKANLIQVAADAAAVAERIRATLPPGMTLEKNYDESEFVSAAIREVYATLAIALLLVVLVIYLFLGSVRAALIPAVTVPICLTASFLVLAAAGATINMMTLLGLVLAIGLVVDDAIVVLENVQRRIELGEPPLIAAYRGTREVGFAVVATTVVVIAVFVPVIFVKGVVGPLFAELGIAVSSAVAFSTLVALTLSAMMCSKLLKRDERRGTLAMLFSRGVDRASAGYGRALEAVVDRPLIATALMGGIFAAGFYLWTELPRELMPSEDRGMAFVNINGPEGAGFDYMLPYTRAMQEKLEELRQQGAIERYFIRQPWGWGGNSFNSAGAMVTLPPWDKRTVSGEDFVSDMNAFLDRMPGVQGRAGMRGGFSRGGGESDGPPVNFVIGGGTYDELAQWRDYVLERAAENPGLIGVRSDYWETQPQMDVQIDRERAADLGVSIEDIHRTLQTMLGGRRVTTFVLDGEERPVMVQLRPEDRAQPNDLANINVRADRTGAIVPLSSLVTLTESGKAPSLNRYNRIRAITITANLAEGYTLGEALEFLDKVVLNELPEGARIDYKGESLDYKQSRDSLAFTLALSLLVVFLVLAAQFESFIHPFVIMLTVPVAMLGALAGLYVAGSTINAYSQIGMVILVGLAAKNGILIVEFANQLRERGEAAREALISACRTRFRPILMTGLSTALGAVPLIIADGAGSAGRMTIGVVIFSGVLFATFVTLFIVPVYYNLLSRFTGAPGRIAREIDAFEARPGAAE